MWRTLYVRDPGNTVHTNPESLLLGPKKNSTTPTSISISTDIEHSPVWALWYAVLPFTALSNGTGNPHFYSRLPRHHRNNRSGQPRPKAEPEATTQRSEVKSTCNLLWSIPKSQRYQWRFCRFARKEGELTPFKQMGNNLTKFRLILALCYHCESQLQIFSWRKWWERRREVRGGWSSFCWVFLPISRFEVGSKRWWICLYNFGWPSAAQ